MEQFSIDFISMPEGVLAVQIQIGDTIDRVEPNLSQWTTDDYRYHWHSQLKLLLNGADRSCLITCLNQPAEAAYLVWWLLYRDGASVKLQNALLLFDDLNIPFSTEALPVIIPDRKELTEDGDTISEWEVPVASIERFVASVAPLG